MERGEATPRTAVRRVAERGSHDPGLIDAVIDEAFICHLGFIEDGIPFVVPRFTDDWAIRSTSTAPPQAVRCGGAAGPRCA